MTSLVAGPASRCAGAGNRVGRDRTSGRAESNGMCGRRSRGRPPEFPNIKERLLAVASDLFYRCGGIGLGMLSLGLAGAIGDGQCSSCLRAQRRRNLKPSPLKRIR